MEKAKQMISDFFVSLGLLILTGIIVIFFAGMVSYVWDHATRIEDVFPLIGDYVTICLYEVFKWLIVISLSMTIILGSCYVLYWYLLTSIRRLIDRMSNPPIEYQLPSDGGVGGGMDTPNEQTHELIGEREVSIFRALGIKSYHPNDSGTVKQIFSAIGREIKGTLPEAATELGKILVSKGVCKFDGGKYVLVSNDKPIEIIQQDDTESASEYYERTGQKIGRVNNRGLASEMIKDFPADERKKYLVGVKNSDKNQTENGQD